MPRDNKNLPDQNLLSQVDKMLSSRGKGLIYNNSLLGFCAKLVSTKPQASKDYRPKLLEKLTRQYSFSPAPALQKKIFNSFSLFSLQKLNLKATSILVSLIFILILVSSLYPQKQSSLGKEGQNQEQLILSSEIPPRDGKTLEKAQTTQLINLSRLPGRIPQGNYRILREDYGFRLIEYVLPDGSRIKILKGLL